MRTAFLMAATCVLTACGESNPSSPDVLTVVLTAPKQTIAVGEPVHGNRYVESKHAFTVESPRFVAKRDESAHHRT